MGNTSEVYDVIVEFDGCIRGQVLGPRTYDDCRRFIANSLPPKGASQLGIRHAATGRLMSYLAPEPTVARRRRLSWAEVTPL